MARDYLVFNTQAEAAAADLAITQSGIAVFIYAGYTADPVNGVTGRSNGVDRPDAAKTVQWSEPFQRMNDNKWIVLHPKYHPAASMFVNVSLGQVSPIDLGEGWVPADQIAMSSVPVGYSIESSEESWWTE